KILAIVLTLAVFSLGFTACKNSNDSDNKGVIIQFEKPVKGQKIATMTIKDFGEVKIMLFDKQAPKTVENFVSLSEDGYFDGISFHRIIENFMIQGGDPTGTGTGGASKWGTKFADEFSPSLRNFTGSISMANSGPNSNGSQFFINYAPELNQQNFDYVKGVNKYSPEAEAKYKEVGGNPHLDNKHSVFGQVFEGLDVIKKVSEVKTVKDKPETPVIIESVKITKAE
ncbi:MAG: peptidylprolyl isomerase, partial [Oscillospiraceae bacterium]